MMNEDEAFRELENRISIKKTHYVSVPAMPKQGVIYEDIAGRRLIVKNVDPLNGAGREVQGFLLNKKGLVNRYYSCPMDTWADIWRDRHPRADTDKIGIG